MSAKLQRYETSADVQQRLLGTVVRLRGRPVHIIDVSPERSVRTQDMLTGVRNWVSSDEEDLDISSPPLGYINDQGRSWYAMRDPARRFRQGLNNENTRVHSDLMQGASQRLFDLSETSIAKGILGEFVPVEDAIRGIRSGDIMGAAIGRRISVVAVTRKLALIRHRGITIGLLPEGVKRGILLEDYRNAFFEGELEQVGL